MAIYWPSTLPQEVNTDNYSRKPQKTFIRSQMSVGPPKQRGRFSAKKEDLDFSLLMTTKQKNTFEDFYHDELSDGDLRFEFPDPENPTDLITVRFRDVYDVSNAGHGMWEISMKIERLP